MKGKKLLSLILSLTLILGLAACGSEAPAPSSEAPEEVSAPSESVSEAPAAEEITVTDMIGREVNVKPGSYEKVVCVGAGALRMYSYVGDVSLLAGIEDIDNLTLENRPKMFDSVARPYQLANAEVFNTLPSCGVGGPKAQTAEAEKILSCEPDIVISEYEDVEKEDALQEQLGVPVITLKTGAGGVFDENFAKSLELLGTIFNEEEKAAALSEFVKNEAEDISERTKDIPEEEKPSVYISGLGNWGTTNHLMTAQNYLPFNIANIKNAVTDLSNDGIQPIEEEKFVALGDNIDIMFIDAAAIKNIKPLYAEDPNMFSSCKAWNEGNVYLQMAYNAYYTNFETALMNTWYTAKVTYPEAFEDVDMTAKVNEISNAFLGKEMAEEIFSCPGSFGGYQKIDTATFFN